MPETPHACVMGMATISEQGHASTVSAMARRSHLMNNDPNISLYVYK